MIYLQQVVLVSMLFQVLVIPEVFMPPAHYSANDRANIVHAVLTAYPASTLQSAHLSFVWQGVGLPQAWGSRVSLSTNMSAALNAGGVGLLTQAQAVHHWGFNQAIPAAIGNDPTFPSNLKGVLDAFNGTSPTCVAAREPELAKLLTIHRLGIARVSKWICFTDQNRYGIYDSRVSIALRGIALSGQRVFPIVARHSTQGRQSFTSDTSVVGVPLRMARAYLDYLAMLADLAAQVHLQPAQVEMALFMLGNVWANGHPKPFPLPKGMWT